MTAMVSVLSTFGSDATVERVLSRLAELDTTGEVLDGHLNASDADVFHHALIESERGDLMWLFEGGEPFTVGMETTGVLFEALGDYALGEPTSGVDAARRDRAWGWASDIALSVAGVELV